MDTNRLEAVRPPTIRLSATLLNNQSNLEYWILELEPGTRGIRRRSGQLEPTPHAMPHNRWGQGFKRIELKDLKGGIILITYKFDSFVGRWPQRNKPQMVQLNAIYADFQVAQF